MLAFPPSLLVGEQSNIKLWKDLAGSSFSMVHQDRTCLFEGRLVHGDMEGYNAGCIFEHPYRY